MRFITCGVAGWCLSTDDLKTVNTRKLAKALALGIEHRGPHATGVAFRTPTGSCPIQIHKQNVDATTFVKRMAMPRKAQVGLVHTRFATQGDPSDNNNNHPISNGGIVGVHNGHVSNDDELFKAVFKAGGERYGKVDSEAIFASIAWGTTPHSPDAAGLADVLESIEGGAAIAWLDESEADDVLHIARIASSPLVFGWTGNGSLIFASELGAIKAAAAAIGVDVNHTVHVAEGTAYRVVAGDVANKINFTPPWRTLRSYGGWSSVGRLADDWEAYRKSESSRVIELPAKTGSTVYPRPVVVTKTEAPLAYSDIADDLTSPLSLCVAAGSSHWDRFKKREDAITKFSKAFTCTGTATDGQAKKNEIMWNMGAFNRVGTWVRTTLQDVDTVGQIYNMPDTFPTGDYVLRVLAYKADSRHDEEWVLVARKHNEFTRHEDQSLKSNGDIDATLALHNTVELSEEDIQEIRRQEDHEADMAEQTTLEEMKEWYLMQEESSADA